MSWQFKKEEKYSVYTPLFSSILELEKALSYIHSDENKIIDCTSLSLTDSTITILSNAYELHLSSSNSFVVVISDKNDMDILEENFVVVPTVSEAIDYIYMEELERNI
tara:strand:+ start:133 stop:456 length:324 start_codon:yes stop_codon:yes gene_type:complete